MTGGRLATTLRIASPGCGGWMFVLERSATWSRCTTGRFLGRREPCGPGTPIRLPYTAMTLPPARSSLGITTESRLGSYHKPPDGGMLAGYEDDFGREFVVELKGNNEIASVPWPSDFPIWFSGAGDQWGVWLMLMGKIALYREGLGVHMMATIGVSGVA